MTIHNILKKQLFFSVNLKVKTRENWIGNIMNFAIDNSNKDYFNYENKINQFRIFVADNDKSILKLYREALSRVNIDPYGSGTNPGEKGDACRKNRFNLTPQSFDVATCQRAEEAVEAVKDSLRYGRPFSVFFVGINISQDPDRFWAVEQIRKLDPDVEIVIMTGYTDIYPHAIASRVPPIHKLLCVQKPLQSHEIYQLAFAFSMKWHANYMLQQVYKKLDAYVEKQIQDFRDITELKHREKELRNARDNAVLRYKHKSKSLSDALKMLEEKDKDLKRYQSDLEKLNKEIIENNQAVSVLARNINRNKELYEDKIYETTTAKIMPIIKALKNNKNCQKIMAELEVLETHMNSLYSVSDNHNEIINILTDQEMRVVALIKRGLTSQKISNTLCISEDTVKTHRKNIRKKLKIQNSNINLISYLKSNMPSDFKGKSQAAFTGEFSEL